MKSIVIVLLLCLNSYAQSDMQKSLNFFDIDVVNFDVFDDVKYQKKYNKTFDKVKFFKKYFEVWNVKQVVSDIAYQESFDFNTIIKYHPCIAENYRELSTSVIKNISDNISILKSEVGVNPKYGLTVETLNTRRFPTDDYCFKLVRNAGEGYPFDYFQYSSLWRATPVCILATSKDKLWHYVSTQNNNGWVPSKGIVILTKRQANNFQKMNFVTPITDEVVITGKKKSYKIHIGTLLPKIGDKILLPCKSFKNRLVYDKVLKNNNFGEFPLKFNKNNFKTILSELLGFKYTWGGLNGGRDCSSTLKDLYVPFGLFLPRNSKQQSIKGTVIALEGEADVKLDKIKSKAIPFLSLLYKRGHIVLYLGLSKEFKPIIFQNLWGIKACYDSPALFELVDKRSEYGLFGFHKKKESKLIETRINIGRVVITPIEPSIHLDSIYKGLTTGRFLEDFSSMCILN